MKILISGANGLVGRATQKILNDKNINFSIISRKESFLKGIYRYSSFSKIDKIEDYNLIIHASAATPNNAKFNDVYQLNKRIDSELEDFIDNVSTNHLIYLSTMAIYGEVDKDIITENTKSNKPNQYGLSKLEGENNLIKICKKKGTKLSILRLPGVVSQGMPAVFFKKAVQNIACGDPITVRNLDAKFNNCIFVDDIAYTILNIFNNQKEDLVVLNLHSKDIVKINLFLKYIGENLQKKPIINISSNCNPSFIISNQYNGDLLITRSVKDCVSSFFKSFK